ncbi:MAG: hypothetical protein ACYSU5_25225 [Planctomycetota bacterium]
MNHPKIQVTDEWIQLLQIQLTIIDASLVLVLPEVSFSSFPKQALWPFAVNRRPAGLLYPHGQIELRLA